jgi:hypothetical protein
MSHFTLINHFGSPSTVQNAYIQCIQTPFTISSITTRSLTLTLPTPGLASHFGSTPLHTLLPNQQTTLPAHASYYSFTFYRLIERQDANLFDFLNSTRCCWVCCSCSRPCFQHGQWSRSEDRFWTSPTIRLSSHGRLEGAYGESILRIIQGFTKI